MYFFVAKLLSIAVMTYSYVYSPQKPTSDDTVNLLCTTRINFTMRSQHVCMTCNPTVV